MFLACGQDVITTVLHCKRRMHLVGQNRWTIVGIHFYGHHLKLGSLLSSAFITSLLISADLCSHLLKHCEWLICTLYNHCKVMELNIWNAVSKDFGLHNWDMRFYKQREHCNQFYKTLRGSVSRKGRKGLTEVVSELLC